MPTDAVSFFPYFPNNRADEHLGPFHVWNWQHHKSKYIEDQAALEFLDRYFSIYKCVRNQPEDRVAIIDYSGNLSPTEMSKEIARFADAAMFSYLSIISLTATHAVFASSSDNFVAYQQPYNLAAPTISLEFGSYIRTQAAGSLDYLTFMTPQHVPDESLAPGDHGLLRQFAQLCDKNGLDVERLFRSLRWVSFAFSNAPGHLYPSRIVAMTTAFEILLDMPEEDKTNEFSARINALLLPNKLQKTTHTRVTKAGNKKNETDNAVGWWCREFYGLRSKIVHGDELQNTDYKTNDVENLRIALHLFRECIDGMMVKLAVLNETDRQLNFWMSQQWIDVLGIPHDAFY
jgi:hypothetical protein